MVILVIMTATVRPRTASLADAKASLSHLVDGAEFKGQSVIITRHGKPAAMLVPVLEPKSTPPRMAKREIKALFALLASQGDPAFSAVDDLISGRR